jgi:hypothetical protein
VSDGSIFGDASPVLLRASGLSPDGGRAFCKGAGGLETGQVDQRRYRLILKNVWSQRADQHPAPQGFHVPIDAGDKVYQAEEVGRRNAKAIRVDVNGPVDYRLDKDHLYIRDPDGKSHKLDLIKTTRRE